MFFVRQLSGVGQSGINVAGVERRIALQDLVLGGTFGKTVKDHGDGNSGSRGTHLAAADLRITTQELLPLHHVPSLRWVPP